MMVTISLIADVFLNECKFDIWIVQTIGSSNSARFKFVKDLSPHRHITYQQLDYDDGVIKRNEHFIDYVGKLRESKIDLFISFNKLAYIDFFTIKELEKSGARIILAPDGAAAYATISWFTPRWSFLVSYNTHRFLWKNGLRKLYFYWPTLVYGGMKEIQELWAQFPESIDQRADKVVRKIDVLKSDMSRQLAGNYFGYKQNEFGDDLIFYANQPFRDERINEFEIDLLKKLRARFPTKQIVVKLHPTTYPEQERRFNELDKVLTVKTTIPAELIIAYLSGAIVLSFWSTSMLVKNDRCRFYWLFPMLAEAGIKLRRMTIRNPSQHISLVNSIDQIS